MNVTLFTVQVVCRHGDVKTTIVTDSPNIPVGLVEAHNAEQPACAPHFVRREPSADS